MQYMSQFFKQTIVEAKLGNATVRRRIRDTPYIMPRGPDAHSVNASSNSTITYQPGMCRAVDGGPQAGNDTIRAMESLHSVAWFSVDGGRGYLGGEVGKPGLNPLGKLYTETCRLVHNQGTHQGPSSSQQESDQSHDPDEDEPTQQ